MREIEVSIDVFAAIWAARLPHEKSENEVLTRLLKVRVLMRGGSEEKAQPAEGDQGKPASKRWTDLLVWTLTELGGRASLSDIYRKSRIGRSALGIPITAEHDASARECLESHCRDSEKYRGKADLFHMPEGKGAGVWALR